jgi:hypothetical protein
MSNQTDRHSHQAIKLLNNAIVIASFAIVAGFILFLVGNAFAVSLAFGIRSLCGGLLPPLAVIYIFRFTKVFDGSYRRRVPRINIYVLSTLWMVLMLIVFDGVYDPENLVLIPIVELMFSLTLVIMVTLYKQNAYPTALAASYGVVSGVFLFTMFVSEI